MSKPLIVVAHPDLEHESRINRVLADAAVRAGLPVNDLYRHYPDFRIDRETEQARLATASALVLQFPLYWYSSPALLKEWLDTVLSHGFAYGRDGRGLRGKRLLLTVSTGDSAANFQEGGRAGASLETLLLPLLHTFRYCGMVLEPVHAIHSADRLDEAGLAETAEIYRRRLLALADAALAEAEPVC